MKSGRQKTTQMFDRRFSILIYAVNKKDTFFTSDISEAVVECSTSAARGYLLDLMELGYIERVTIYEYKATQMLKELFNIKGDEDQYQGTRKYIDNRIKNGAKLTKHRIDL